MVINTIQAHQKNTLLDHQQFTTSVACLQHAMRQANLQEISYSKAMKNIYISNLLEFNRIRNL